MASSPKYDNVQVCNENIEKDEYHILLACSVYKVSSKKYYDLLDGHDI